MLICFTASSHTYPSSSVDTPSPPTPISRDSPCPPGSFGAKYVEDDPTSCTPCPAGTYFPAYGAREKSECGDCPAGTWTDKRGLKLLTECIKCSAGRFGTTSGQIKEVAACQTCAPGQYQEKVAAVSCTFCSAGSYGVVPAETSEKSACKKCDAGRFSPIPGANSATLCSACPGGRWGSKDILPASMSHCVACDPGRSGTRSGQASATAACVKVRREVSCCCVMRGVVLQTSTASYIILEYDLTRVLPVKCAAGRFQAKPASAACDACPAGSFGNLTGQADETGACSLCGKGKFSDIIGLPSESRCKSCSPGSYNNVSGWNDQYGCTLCKKRKSRQYALVWCP